MIKIFCNNFVNAGNGKCKLGPAFSGNKKVDSTLIIFANKITLSKHVLF